MKTMPMTSFREAVNGLTHPPSEVAVSHQMGKALEYNLAQLSIKSTMLAGTLFNECSKERSGEALKAFIINKSDGDLVEIENATGPKVIREAIADAGDDAAGYLIAMYTMQLRGATSNREERERLDAILNDGVTEENLDDVVATVKREFNVEIGHGLTLITVTRNKLWSLVLANREGVDILALSDWDGDMAMDGKINGNGPDLVGFTGFFGDEEAFPISEWAHCIDETKKDTRNVEMTLNHEELKRICEDPSSMLKLLEQDGHDGFRTAYGILAELATAKKSLFEISVKDRKVLIELFEARASQLRSSIEFNSADNSDERVQ